MKDYYSLSQKLKFVEVKMDGCNGIVESSLHPFQGIWYIKLTGLFFSFLKF